MTQVEIIQKSGNFELWGLSLSNRANDLAYVLMVRVGQHAKRFVKTLPKTEQVGSPV